MEQCNKTLQDVPQEDFDEMLMGDEEMPGFLGHP
jgi:hypothetical protein